MKEDVNKALMIDLNKGDGSLKVENTTTLPFNINQWLVFLRSLFRVWLSGGWELA